jgi:hypothetical protein
VVLLGDFFWTGAQCPYSHAHAQKYGGLGHSKPSGERMAHATQPTELRAPPLLGDLSPVYVSLSPSLIYIYNPTPLLISSQHQSIQYISVIEL